MKSFINHDFPKLKRVDSPSGRVYETSTGAKYPSVTSVVGLLKERVIQEWRDRVGHEQARRISSLASKRGTQIHDLCETYLKTGAAYPDFFDKEMFDSLTPHLERIDNIHCLETKVFSHHLKAAGTVDCIGEYDGKMSVIDFKTSSRLKSRDDIHDYFMQTAAYAVMFEELTSIPVNRLVIIMAVDHEQPLVFQERRNDWIEGFKDLRKQYFDRHQI